MIEVSTRIRIPESELVLTFVRSSGPGGQNVNKVSSKAVLEWQVAGSPSLPDDVRERFLTRYRSRLTRDGRVQLASQRYRDQTRNAEDCRQRLAGMLSEVAEAPVKRKPSKPSQGARQRRLLEKRVRSDRKQNRRRPGAND